MKEVKIFDTTYEYYHRGILVGRIYPKGKKFEGVVIDVNGTRQTFECSKIKKARSIMKTIRPINVFGDDLDTKYKVYYKESNNEKD